jgi:hypothetical protein
VPRPVRTHPLFFARLHLALLGLADAIDSEVEYVGRHLADVEARFAASWDDLPRDSDDDNVRYVTGIFEAIPALFVIEGRLVDSGTLISIRNIRIVPIPSEPEA